MKEIAMSLQGFKEKTEDLLLIMRKIVEMENHTCSGRIHEEQQVVLRRGKLFVRLCYVRITLRCSTQQFSAEWNADKRPADKSRRYNF